MSAQKDGNGASFVAARVVCCRKTETARRLLQHKDIRKHTDIRKRRVVCCGTNCVVLQWNGEDGSSAHVSCLDACLISTLMHTCLALMLNLPHQHLDAHVSCLASSAHVSCLDAQTHTLPQPKHTLPQPKHTLPQPKPSVHRPCTDQERKPAHRFAHGPRWSAL